MRAVVVLIGLAIAPALSAQAQDQPFCALHEPDAPRLHGHGAILGFQSVEAARAGIARRQAARGGAIDPRYLDDARVVVRQDDGIVDTYDVPAGMQVHVGQRVRLQGSYRSTAAPCAYVPHMVIADDGPAA